MHVHARERVLGVGEALLGGPAKPLHRLDVVLRDAIAPGIHVPKSGLSLGVALLSKRTKEAELGRIITSPVSRTRIVERPGTRRTGERGYHEKRTCCHVEQAHWRSLLLRMQTARARAVRLIFVTACVQAQTGRASAPAWCDASGKDRSTKPPSFPTPQVPAPVL